MPQTGIEPADYKSAALPIEPHRRITDRIIDHTMNSMGNDPDRVRTGDLRRDRAAL